jgi:hypothetical protein
MGIDHFQKGRTRNPQVFTSLLGRENLALLFCHCLSPLLVLSPKKNRASSVFGKPGHLHLVVCLFGNPADPPLGPVAFRPTLTGGLALSETLFASLLSESHANWFEKKKPLDTNRLQKESPVTF